VFCNFLFCATKDSLALAIAMVVPRDKLQLETQRLSNPAPIAIADINPNRIKKRRTNERN
jgi:hypothetical protein